LAFKARLRLPVHWHGATNAGLPLVGGGTADISRGIRASERLGSAAHISKFPGAEELLQLEGQVLNTIHFRGGAMFEEEITVGSFLPGNWIDDQHRLAHGERLGAGESARLGDDQVGRTHQFLHILYEPQDLRRMGSLGDGQFLSQFLVATGDDQRVEMTFHLVELRERLGQGPHAKSPGKHQQHRKIVAQSVTSSNVQDVELLRELRGHGDSGHRNAIGVHATGDQAALRFLGGHAIIIHGRFQPESVRFEVSHDADGERIGAIPLLAKMRDDFERQVVRTDQDVGPERFQKLDEAFVGMMRKAAPERIGPANFFVVVGLLENQRVKLGGVLDDFDVGIDVNLPLQLGGEVENVHFLQDILRTKLSPGFLKSGCCGEMATACCNCCDQDPHSAPRFSTGLRQRTGKTIYSPGTTEILNSGSLKLFHRSNVCLHCNMAHILIVLLSVFAPILVLSVSAAESAKPHIVFVTGDHEYGSERTMPLLAEALEKYFNFKTTVLYAVDEKGNRNEQYEKNIPGLQHLATADVAVFFLRWRKLPKEQLEDIDKYLKSGKPVIGFRTSTHAFNYPKEDELVRWNAFGEFALGSPPGWGASGHTHYGHKSSTDVSIAPGATNNPILNGVDKEFHVRSWLYRVVPDYPPVDATRLLIGKAVDPDKPAVENPVAWTWKNQWGGKVFTTTMGHPEDFQVEAFQRLVVNAVHWAAGKSVPEKWPGKLPILVSYDKPQK
jgi:type 1 glutamine amidotransferase